MFKHKAGRVSLTEGMAKILSTVMQGAKTKSEVFDTSGLDPEFAEKCMAILQRKGFISQEDGTFKASKRGEELVKAIDAIQKGGETVGARVGKEAEALMMEELRRLDRLFESGDLEVEEYVRRRKQVLQKFRGEG